MEQKIITGTLTYREVEFTFVYSDDVLRLIPPDNKKQEILFTWVLKETGNGGFAFGTLVMDESTLIGKCNESNETAIFFPVVGEPIGFNNSVLFVAISAVIICKTDLRPISRVSFLGAEINHIHPIQQAVSIDASGLNEGTIKLVTNTGSKTKTREQLFLASGKEVKSHFGICSKVSTKSEEPLLSLESALFFEFEPTNDYVFVLKLWEIATKYIRFLCYRRNVVLDKIQVYSTADDGLFEDFGELSIVGVEKEVELLPLKKDYCIKQTYIADGEQRILQDIADNTIYIRHLPKSYESSHSYDAARFVMITAAFEWEFGRIKPDGLEKDKRRQEAEAAAYQKIDELILATSGKEKEIFKFLKKQIGSASLEDKINKLCMELDSIIGIFGKHLYSLNKEAFSYNDIGNRLATQRNRFAHGDIDKDFIGLALLDLTFLEMTIYAMQLNFYGINTIDIKRAINTLFHRGLAIP